MVRHAMALPVCRGRSTPGQLIQRIVDVRDAAAVGSRHSLNSRAAYGGPGCAPASANFWARCANRPVRAASVTHNAWFGRMVSR